MCMGASILAACMANIQDCCNCSGSIARDAWMCQQVYNPNERQ